jgi:hypothetical protein
LARHSGLDAVRAVFNPDESAIAPRLAAGPDLQQAEAKQQWCDQPANGKDDPMRHKC